MRMDWRYHRQVVFTGEKNLVRCMNNGSTHKQDNTEEIVEKKVIKG